MMKRAWALMLLLAAAWGACGAEPPAMPSPAVLAASMRQARLSDGFEVRMRLSTIDPEGHRSAPVKLALIGQFGADTARLLVRGISPESARDQLFAAERDANGRIRSVRYGSNLADGIVAVDPFTQLFGSDLVLWDLLSPWWDWSQQSPAGTGKAAGHDCAIVRSQANATPSRIREVMSCVDAEAGLAFRTELFDGHRAPARTIVVEQSLRKASGPAFVKRITIVSADKSTEIDVYAGDENYVVAADTFAALDARPAPGKQADR